MQDFHAQLRTLGELLLAYQADWRFLPFDTQHWPWPELAFLQDKTPDELEGMEQATLHALLDRHRPGLSSWHAKALPRISGPALALPERLAVGMGGRKWQQIQDFSAAVAPRLPVLEWCAGKGHLGRALASQGLTVQALEWQQSLCDQGQDLARQWQLDHQFVCADALAPDSGRWVKAQQHAVALHACGDLHSQLLVHAVKAGTQAISLSPCCYHLIAGDRYQPLSALGRQLDLGLTRFDLRLPLQELVTGGDRAERLRHKELGYRLAFDSLQRQLRGDDSYLPVPNAPKSLFSGDFASFAHWAADKKGLALPAKMALEPFLAEGLRRHQKVRRLDWVRHWYRRPLELWLLLDRVCYLVDAGYQVRLGSFTDKAQTPRNALIDARKGDA